MFNSRVSSSKWFRCCLANRSLTGQGMQPGLARDNLFLLFKKGRKKGRREREERIKEEKGRWGGEGGRKGRPKLINRSLGKSVQGKKLPNAALPEQTLGLPQDSGPSNQGHLTCPEGTNQIRVGLLRGTGETGRPGASHLRPLSLASK